MEFNGETQNNITKKVKYWCGVFFFSENVAFTLIFDMFPSPHQYLPEQAENDKCWTKVMNNVEICQLLTTSQKDVILARVKVWCYNHLYDIICKYLCDVLLWHTHKTRLWLPYLLASLVVKIGLIVCNDMLRLTFSFLALTSFIWLFASCKMSLSCISCTICSVHDVSCKCKSVWTQFNNTHTEHTVLRS